MRFPLIILLVASHNQSSDRSALRRQGLGISIVGGKLEAPEGSDSPSLSGIFIKNVLSGSPAAATNQLNTGDRIIAVGDVDLRYASHDKVGTIQPEWR